MAQLRMFSDEAPPPPVVKADPDRVRRKLAAFLTEAREAGAQGLPLERRRLIETVVPQMTRWLPKEEAERTRNAFEEALTA
jgi:DNA repair photolyase